jgi:hypothetical protein
LLIYKPSINNLNDLKLLSRAIQIPFFILLHLALLDLMDLHLPHIVHFPDSGWNLHHQHLNVSTIHTAIHIVICDVVPHRSSTTGLVERESDYQQGIDPPKFHIGTKSSFVLDIHIKNLGENSLIQNRMNLILVINVDKKCNYIDVVY